MEKISFEGRSLSELQELNFNLNTQLASERRKVIEQMAQKIVEVIQEITTKDPGITFNDINNALTRVRDEVTPEDAF